jgi:hypothetical protein
MAVKHHPRLWDDVLPYLYISLTPYVSYSFLRTVWLLMIVVAFDAISVYLVLVRRQLMEATPLA